MLATLDRATQGIFVFGLGYLEKFRRESWARIAWWGALAVLSGFMALAVYPCFGSCFCGDPNPFSKGRYADLMLLLLAGDIAGRVTYAILDFLWPIVPHQPVVRSASNNPVDFGDPH
jgi:hypothetical protein